MDDRVSPYRHAPAPTTHHELRLVLAGGRSVTLRSARLEETLKDDKAALDAFLEAHGLPEKPSRVSVEEAPSAEALEQETEEAATSLRLDR